ncbi:unnamed protein product [Adineta ricciae]|uniref:Uncharacterized protein n=1 Tax=Adineta ricciae TaxID=249248 RepID=A0A814TNH1_ADIRI|nr:unnamed protein product [Adineta ricciae]CAF1163228.1 unnamed protein product [Adineta ricciae]
MISTTSKTGSPTTTTRSLGRITRAGDTIVGLYNTTAGGSTGAKNGRYSGSSKTPIYAVVDVPGVDTGFYVTSSISNASIAVGLFFATANDGPNHDPLSASFEGTNSDACNSGSSRTLFYNGSTGINAIFAPDRMTYCIQKNFANITPSKSYRLLVTSQRDPEWAFQYSGAHVIGYT